MQVYASIIPETKKVVAVLNDITEAKVLAHLLKYDSVHGKFGHEVSYADNALIIDGKEIPVFKERNPANIPWDTVEATMVFESTGLFRKYELASKHLERGVERVIVSAPDKGKENPIPTYVLGVNHEKFNPETDLVVSNASCTTNCYAPVTKIIDDNFTVLSGFMTTIHSYTNDQRILDLPHSDLRRARAAAMSMIPTSTGAAKAVGKVLPHLEGKLQAMSIRVPTPNVSLIDAVYELQKNVSVDEVNSAFEKAAQGELKGIIDVSNELLVSTDYNGSAFSAIVDLASTMVYENKVKILAWYDNETGYSHRMIDLALYIASKI